VRAILSSMAASKLNDGLTDPNSVPAPADAARTKPGENVLDLFGGSGSTLIAAEQAGRRAFLMELDTLYCDVIVERWEKFTGGKAERE